VQAKGRMSLGGNVPDNAFARAIHKKIADELDRAIEEAGEADEMGMQEDDDDDEQDTEVQRDRTLIKQRDPI